jgi:RNA polymerase sigma factor (sigma-70 family)
MADHAPIDPIEDRDVFEHLFKQGHDRLVEGLIGLVRDRDRAEDIAAAAFQAAWEKREQFRGDASLETWLHAIGQNAARDSWRHQRAADREPIERLEMARHAEPDRLSARLEQDELRARVWETLHRIPASCRRILIDRYIDGRSVQEIAQRQRIPIGTVGSRLFAARRLLREAWPATAVRMLGRDMPEQKSQHIAEEALKRLTEELQAGRSETLKTYLAAMGRFHRYSWNNVLLIQAQRPGATRVAGYHTWHELGRSVRRGEKGIMILAPIRLKQPEPVVAPEARERSSDSSRVAGFRAAYVFDVEQTEGRPLPPFAATTGDPKDHLENLKALVARRNISLEYDASISPAQGTSAGGRIRLLPGMAAAEEFSVLTHELAHEMLHHGPGGPGHSGLTKAMRETQAEAVAYVVSRGIGLETGTAAADYIALYDRDAANAAKSLAESLVVIQETSSRILKELLPEERTPPTPEKAFDSHARLTPAPQPSAEAPSHLHRPAARPAPEQGDSLSLDR